MADENENVDNKMEQKDTDQEEQVDERDSDTVETAGEDSKPPKKASTNKESQGKKGEDDEEESEEEEEHLGILDLSPLVDGKRERTCTKFFMQDFPPPSTERMPMEIPKGRGLPLGEIPYVVEQLSSYKAKELQPLHKLLFGRTGRAKDVKKNIRQFSGFDVEKDSKEYEKRKEKLQTFTVNSLRNLCEIFGVDKGKGKEEKKAEAVLERMMDYLMEPKVTKEVPIPVKSGTKRKRPKKESKETVSEKKKSKETVSDGDEEEEEDDDEGDDEEEDKEEDKEEEEKTPPPKKQKTSTKKKETKKKETKKSPKKDKKVVAIKIAPAKKSKKQKVEQKHDSGDSDDEPLVKKTKKSPPTDDELASLVKELLDGADLEKITMKSVCKQVFDRFPDFDLSSRKDFIKETVKEIIT